MKLSYIAASAVTLMAIASPVLAQQAAPVPTTKVLAISQPLKRQPSPQEMASIMQHEVRDTVGAYLDGKIDQWYYQTGDKPGVVFVINARTVEEARAVMEQMPLDKAGIAEYQYIPIGPLNPLRILMNTPIPK